MGGPRGGGYFETVVVAHARRAETVAPVSSLTRGTTFGPPPFFGTNRSPRKRPGVRCLKPSGRAGRPKSLRPCVSCAAAALADGRDRERRVDAERGRDRRGVHAEEPLVAEHLAAVVHDPEVRRLGHPAAAERMRRVATLRLGELHEAAEPAALADLLHRRVRLLAHADRLLRQRVVERPIATGPAFGRTAPPWRRHRVRSGRRGCPRPSRAARCGCSRSRSRASSGGPTTTARRPARARRRRGSSSGSRGRSPGA